MALILLKNMVMAIYQLVGVFGFIFGAILGSFLKVLADRSISQKKFTGRSQCEFCKKSLGPQDLIPIFSYIILKGRCRYCHKKLSIDYLLLEVLMGLLLALIFFQTVPANIFSLDWGSQILVINQLVIKIFIISVFIICFLTDFKTGLIYDRITFPSIAFITLLLFWDFLLRIFLIYQGLSSDPLGKYLLPPNSDYLFRHALISAEPLISGLVSAILMVIFFGSIILVTKGRGMGGGDLKLGIFIGLAFGFPLSVLVLMLAFLTGSIVGIILLIVKQKKFGQTIPFGPFLALGAIVTLFWGKEILNWYLNYQIL